MSTPYRRITVRVAVEGPAVLPWLEANGYGRQLGPLTAPRGLVTCGQSVGFGTDAHAEFVVYDDGGKMPADSDSVGLLRWALDRMPKQVEDWDTLTTDASMRLEVEVER